MKFEKFIKRVGSRGILLTDDNGNKWICDGNVAMIVPPGVNVAYSVTAKMPACVSDMLDYTAFPTETFCARLVRAELAPDGKAKDIRRIYADPRTDDEIGIYNPDWALIESGDKCNIGVDEVDDDVVEIIGLVVFTGYGDNTEVVGIIFDEAYDILNAIKEENNNGN